MAVSIARGVLRPSRFLTFAIVCGLASMALAADGVRPDTRTARGPAATAIVGSAWNVDNSPLAGARVQLRDIVSGKVRGAAIADESGRFTFTNIEGGSYAVELLGANGKVLTVGHAFVVAPGETVATFVRLANKVPWFTGFFGNAAGAVVSAASSQGITALAPVQLPLSPPSSAR